MEWRKLKKDEASKLADEWNSTDDFSLIIDYWDSNITSELSTPYIELREFLWKAFRKAEDESSSVRSNRKYVRDITFALSFYQYMNETMGLTPSLAADDDIWRYIQMKVVPDLVFERWQHCEDEGVSDSVRIKADSFWEDSRRIWMKSRWWYVHLSLQNDSIEDTRSVIIGNSMDEISHMVERPGSGYRVELCRAIMLRYHKSPKKNRMLLRKIMKLNTVRCSTTEPLLFSTGVVKYVEDLFGYFEA